MIVCWVDVVVFLVRVASEVRPKVHTSFSLPFFQNTQDIDTGMYTTHKLVNTTEIWVGSRPIPQASR